LNWRDNRTKGIALDPIPIRCYVLSAKPEIYNGYKLYVITYNTPVLTLMNYNVLCNCDLCWLASKVQKGPECLGNVIHLYTLIKYIDGFKIDKEKRDRGI
jgi:hypothetical protein